MPLYHTYKQGNLTVGVWKVDETVEQLRSMFHQFSMYEAGFSRFTSESRQREWLAVRVLLKELCGEEKKIGYLPSGKPYLEDGSMRVSFSHTKGYVAVAIHPDYKVGVDIEQYGERVKKVASRFIHEDEKPSVLAGDEVYTLLLHWSAKETMYKLMEEEAVDFARHLRIHPFIASNSGELSAVETRTDAQTRFRIFYETHTDYVLTYAVLSSW